MVVKKENWVATRPWLDYNDADVEGYVASLKDDPGYDLTSKLKGWCRDGVVIFENIVSHELIDALVSDVSYLRKHHQDFELFAELRGAIKPIGEFTADELTLDGVKFNSIQSLSMAAARLSLTREIASFLGHVFKSPACVLQSLTFYKGSQQPIHVDYPYVRCQTKIAHLAASWIPLEDIRPDSGPLAYYPGSHHLYENNMFDWGNGSILYETDSVRQPHELSIFLDEQMRRLGIEAEVFCPKKGDALLWHGNLSHAGTHIINSDATRKSYVTHYTSLDAYPPLHRFQDRPLSQAGLYENNGYCFSYPWTKSKNKLPSSYSPNAC